MIMPFGKYRGETVDDLDTNYLMWLWANVRLREPLLSEVRRVLYPDTGRSSLPSVDVVKATYRELSRKYHPDRYGEQGHLAQCAINEFYERLSQREAYGFDTSQSTG